MHCLRSRARLAEPGFDLITPSENAACEGLQSGRVNNDVPCHDSVELVILLAVGGIGYLVRGLGDIAERAGCDERGQGKENESEDGDGELHA